MSGEDYATHADLGGQLGHGRIELEAGFKPWHAAWEPRVFALQLSMGAAGVWNLDMTRSVRETLPDYHQRSYYEIWFAALLKQLEGHGLVSAEELAAGRMLRPPITLPRVVHARDVATLQARGAPTERPATKVPRFSVGQQVRTISGPIPHHTRLPGYAQGKTAVIERLHGVHVFADANASGRGEQPEWLYTVVFRGTDLWPDAERGLTVSIDAWEPYLEAA
ncbi:nitrile hydratase subunit beta [Mycobacterium arosiense]|uniref:nitrile hydratase n=1 Tax=Mycobacterium arosiense ATCC BAA-1401 = DSM 45069 TaxID=1265311 RepID=A0A1W9ZC18_MYCAI|nr:nitrile hydratase subunit beta [Mycobacterium arosiense]ORA11399.1 nitrile hydratase subunit beta [Mycobacterium arosiense ATCC BAA-1401 = DSM 45069]